jgi:3-hydroxyacyl-CoA dehydrogenase, NAD binding domain
MTAEVIQRLNEQDRRVLRCSPSRVNILNAGFIGHPFNPPHVVPLVEVVAGEKTSSLAVQQAISFYKGREQTFGRWAVNRAAPDRVSRTRCAFGCPDG